MDRAGRKERGWARSRLEAFSDGTIAVIITIMVLEMKVPHGGKLIALQPVIPVFVSYALSFVTSASTETTITTCEYRSAQREGTPVSAKGRPPRARIPECEARR